MNQDSQPTTPSEPIDPKDQATPQPPTTQPPSQPAPKSPPPQPQPVINIQASPQPTSPQPTQPTPPQIQEKPSKPPLNMAQEKEKIVNKLGVLAGIIFGAIEATLGLRLIFKLLGANPNNLFINALYQFTSPFVAPFVGIFSIDLSFGRFSFDIPTIIAMVIYSLVACALFWATKLL